MDYRLASVDAAIERAFMARWHYSGTTVPNSAVRLGAFSGSRLMGVISFGRIINCVPIFRGVSNRAGLEINRLAMLDEAPRNSESWFIARAIHLLRRGYPWLRFVHTWADGRCSGGVIYRAAGFLYLRKIRGTGFYLLPGGRVMHRVAFNKVYLKRYGPRLRGLTGIDQVRAVFGDGAREIETWQHHYVKLIDPTLRPLLLFGPLPYERRSSNGKAPEDHSGDGGSKPTPALQPASIELPAS